MTRAVLPQLGPDADYDALRAAFSWDIPADFNIAQACLWDWVDRAPQNVAIIDRTDDGTRREWTFADLAEATRALAATLADHGVGRGDRVAIILPQSAHVMIAHFAIYHLGAIALPLFGLFGPEAMQFRLQDAGAKLVITNDTQRGKLDGLQAGLPDLQAILSCDDPGFFTPSGPTPPRQLLGADDPALMVYTSGTTGNPKGVLHAHRYLYGHLPSIEMTHAPIADGQGVGWTPADWAWVGGLMDLALPCLYYGLPLVAARFSKFSAEAAVDLLTSEGVTNAFIPPTALKLMRQMPKPPKIALKTVTSGGEPLGDDLVAWADQALGVELNEIFGQTECNLCISAVGYQGIRRPGSMGRAVPGFDIAILNDAGERLPAGQIGQIAIHRDNACLFLGYWQQPEKTAEKFIGDWLITGDLGRMDADGYITYVARDDDLINSAGYRIGPAEIEASLARDPDVIMAAAIGVPDPLKGEVVQGFVTVTAPRPGLEDDLIARVRREISPHVAPKRITVIADMPLTATGKVMRRVLRDQAIQSSENT